MRQGSGEGLQERDELSLLLVCQPEWLDAGVEGRVRHAAAIVELDDVGEAGRRAVVQIWPGERDIAETRRLEPAAIRRIVCHRLAADVRVRQIHSHADVVKRLIGEQGALDDTRDRWLCR